MPNTVYLLHFDTPLHHAQHYMGFTDNLEARLLHHRGGTGARLMEVLREHNIGFSLVRTWDGDRNKERRLKKWKNGRQLCPVCREAARQKAREARKEGRP